MTYGPSRSFKDVLEYFRFVSEGFREFQRVSGTFQGFFGSFQKVLCASGCFRDILGRPRELQGHFKKLPGVSRDFIIVSSVI